MKTLSIVRKTLLELWREPLLLVLLLFFPTMLIGFYYIAFGQTEGGLATYLSVLVANQDEGHSGQALIDTLRDVEWEGEPIFDIQVVEDPRAAEIALRERKVALLLTIPPGFSGDQAATAAGETSARPPEISLLGDPGSETYVFALSFLNGLIREFAAQTAGEGGDAPEIVYEFIPGTGTMSDFDFGVGGIIVFGVTFVVITTATVLVREDAADTLRRLRLAGVGAGALLLGVTLAQMVVSAVQIPITFGVAVLMGFQSNGSLLLAMGVGLLVTLSAVGVGLIVACFARTDGEAANLGSVALVPLVFLSGALYPMPEMPLFTAGGRTVQVYDLIPATHGAEALRRVLIFGEGLREICYELAALTILAGLLLGLGVVLYHRLKLRRV